MSNSGNCSGMNYLKAGACMMLFFALVGCKSRPTGKETNEVSPGATQVAGNSGPSAALAAKPEVPQGEKKVVFRNIAGDVRFVGSEACASCHWEIYKKYMRTPHGHAATLPSQRPELRDLPDEGVTVCEKDGSHCFKVFRQNGDFYMGQFEPGPNATEIPTETHKIVFALGAPMAGVGYGIKRGNYLFEAPLSYYSGSQDMYPKGWGISPGYERAAYGFARPLVGSCMYCHVGRALVVDDANNLYQDPPIGELKVGCENCHGPGKLHVDEQRKHMPVAGKIDVPISGNIDTSIVSSAHLSPRISDDMCIYCHEFGEARIPQPGKKFEDFIPGTPLLNTMAIFKTRPVLGWNMMEWSDEMALSKCYRASGGRLNCGNCHDGHSSPTAQEAPAFYRSKCLNCHQKRSCRESLDKRHSTSSPDNCVSCHMPKHVAPRFVMLGTQGTSHRIVAYEGEPFSTIATQQNSPDPATGLILVDRIHGSTRTALSPLVILQAYQSVLRRRPNRTDIKGRYNQLLDRLAKSDPMNVTVLSALANRELERRSPEGNSAAENYLSKAVELRSKSPQDYMRLAELLYRSGHRMEAINILRRAVSLFPYIPTPYENLSFCYVSIGDGAKAKEIVKDGLSIFPSDAVLQAMRRKVDASETPP
jgi:hypothetical protein